MQINASPPTCEWPVRPCCLAERSHGCGRPWWHCAGTRRRWRRASWCRSSSCSASVSLQCTSCREPADRPWQWHGECSRRWSSGRLKVRKRGLKQKKGAQKWWEESPPRTGNGLVWLVDTLRWIGWVGGMDAVGLMSLTGFDSMVILRGGLYYAFAGNSGDSCPICSARLCGPDKWVSECAFRTLRQREKTVFSRLSQ